MFLSHLSKYFLHIFYLFLIISFLCFLLEKHKYISRVFTCAVLTIYSIPYKRKMLFWLNIDRLKAKKISDNVCNSCHFVSAWMVGGGVGGRGAVTTLAPAL